MRQLISDYRRHHGDWRVQCHVDGGYVTHRDEDGYPTRTLPTPTGLGLRLLAVWSLARERLERLGCFLFGHRWVDESWGNRETGGVAYYCRRCGESHSHTFY